MVGWRSPVTKAYRLDQPDQQHTPAAALAGFDRAIADEGGFDGFVEGFVPSEGFAETDVPAFAAGGFQGGEEVLLLFFGDRLPRERGQLIDLKAVDIHIDLGRRIFKRSAA